MADIIDINSRLPLAPSAPGSHHSPAAKRTESEVRAEGIARELYFRLRSRGQPPADALASLQTVLASGRADLPPDAPPPEPVRGWAIEHSWERRFSQQESLRPLDGETQRAAATVEETKIYLQKAKDRLDAHTDKEEGWGEAGTKIFVALSGQVLRWQSALGEAEDHLRQLILERQTEEARQQAEALYTDLIEQYGGMGKQYELLCKRLAEITVKIEQANASGRLVSAEEFSKLYDMHIKAVGQLQKYTEATKSETLTKETREYLTALLRVMEPHLAPVAPSAWRDALQAVRAKINATPQQEAG